MKKSAYLLLLVSTFAIALGACTKCTVCTRVDQTTGDEIIEEYCGNGSQITNFENEWAVNYDSLGGYCARN